MAEIELPVEIITEILTLLPVKSLTRFKCVSKSWNSLISSPSFINHHLKQTLASNPNPNIVIIHNSLISALIFDNDNNLHFSELNHPLKLLPTCRGVHLIGSCNGILLISYNTKPSLYNPANNTYRSLPPIPAWSRNYEAIGFGYDSHTDDYKVIMMAQNPGVNTEVCVYSMRENVWKLIKDESALMRKHYIMVGPTVGANRVLHVLAVTKERKPVVLCFDVRTEVFSIVDFPELECYNLSKFSESMTELRGCLCLVVNFRKKGGQLTYADVWEMREGGKKAPSPWIKLCRIQKSELVEKGKPCTYLKLLAYSKDKSKVLVRADYNWFGWYDLVNKSVKKVKTHGLRVEDSPYVFMTYVESLVSVSNVFV